MLLQADDIDKHVCGESDTDMIYYLQVVCTGLYYVWDKWHMCMVPLMVKDKVNCSSG